MKDWVGNNKDNVFKILGASSHSKNDREENDFYATDPKSVQLFLDRIKLDKDFVLPKNIFEPCCGKGHISKKLIENGYNVISSDLIDRDYGISPVNYLTDSLDFAKSNFDCILTNPPYKYALEFIYKSLEITNKYVIMYLRLQFLEGKERNKLYKTNPPKFIYVNSSRQGCTINAENEKFPPGAMAYAWYVWEKGFKGEPILRWID